MPENDLKTGPENDSQFRPTGHAFRRWHHHFVRLLHRVAAWEKPAATFESDVTLSEPNIKAL